MVRKKVRPVRKNVVYFFAFLFIPVLLSADDSSTRGIIERLMPRSMTRYDYTAEWDLKGVYRCCLLVAPIPIAVSPDGDVFVADPLTGRVHRYDPMGNLLDEWYVVPPPPPGTAALARYSLTPYALAVAPDGKVYALCGDMVCYFSPEGVYLGTWGSRGTGDGQFGNPAGLAAGSNGRVYVVDTFNERVQYFSSTGSFLGKWGSFGAAAGKFHYPESIAVAPDGEVVYVADTLNERVQYFSADGSFLGAWGEEGTGRGQFEYPKAVAVAPSGEVFVSDMSKDNVEYFDRRGRFKGVLEYKAPPRRGDFFWGVAAAPSGDVYVADGRDLKIRKFKRSVDKRIYVWVIIVATVFVASSVGSFIIYRALKRRLTRVTERGRGGEERT